jgi:uncharacterized protein DUF3991/Toprim domain-containing protein
MPGVAGGIQPATRRATSFASCKGWSQGLVSGMSASASENSLDCHQAFRQPIGQGAGRIRTSVADRWAERKAVWSNSPTWRYLKRKRGLSAAIIEAAAAAGVLREGPVGSAWFAHFDRAGAVAHVDVRGPTYKGSLTGGAKSLFRLSLNGPPLPRLVLTEAAIDALSIAAIESLRRDTLYAATGGGMGPGTIAALEALLVNMAMLPGALFCSATDANGPGERFADRHRSLAEKYGNQFARLRPPIEGADWNDVLRAQSEAIGRKPKES